jgi:hypothetical protein
MGAWKYLSDFAFAAVEDNIPVVQFVHDYSLICLFQWLLDSRHSLCTGPTSDEKCISCFRRSLRWKGRIPNALLSVPFLGSTMQGFIGSNFTKRLDLDSTVRRALSHMQTYRDGLTFFIAQSPSVIDVLASARIEPSRCRFVPQYIGEDKLRKYNSPSNRSRQQEISESRVCWSVVR